MDAIESNDEELHHLLASVFESAEFVVKTHIFDRSKKRYRRMAMVNLAIALEALKDHTPLEKQP